MLESMNITSQQELEQQQDASECIETMVREIPQLSFLLHQTLDQITCTRCGYYKAKKSSQIPVTSIAIPGSKRNRDEEEKFSAKDAIRRHFQDHEDGIKNDCENCKYEFCSKEINIENQPNYIIIQLKRFSAIKEGNTMVLKKIFKESEPFSVVDINTSHGTKIYKVIATIEHTGHEIETGHYMSYVLKNDTWYCCDDERVEKLPKNYEKHIENAYILVLKKVIE